MAVPETRGRHIRQPSPASSHKRGAGPLKEPAPSPAALRSRGIVQITTYSTAILSQPRNGYAARSAATLLQQLQHTLRHLVGLGSSAQSPLVSVSAWRRKLRPLPCASSPHAAHAARGPRRDGHAAPGPGWLCSPVSDCLTGAAAARPEAPGWPGPAWPGRTGSGCCSWCRPSSRRPRRCRGWRTRRW